LCWFVDIKKYGEQLCILNCINWLWTVWKWVVSLDSNLVYSFWLPLLILLVPKQCLGSWNCNADSSSLENMESWSSFTYSNINSFFMEEGFRYKYFSGDEFLWLSEKASDVHWTVLCEPVILIRWCFEIGGWSMLQKPLILIGW